MADLFPSWAARRPCALPSAALRGQTVLVTGAGGSLGAALARRLSGLPLRRLVLVDTSEHSLVRLRQRLEARDPGPRTTYRLADLRLAADRARVLRTGPTTVVHAAAYKHVPFLEARPIPATQNNLLATADWLADCRAHASVERFVLVSTDKAVRPVGVMGATKAAAEQLLVAARALDAPGLVPTTVRLCNIFGSRGSVVPHFCRRLRAGEALPVTHPDMERWFMAPAAAARAVLHGPRQAGGTYVPTECRTINIEALARRLVRWHRPSAEPEAWIRHVGLRAGERLEEALTAPPERPTASVEGPLERTQSRPAPPLDVLREDLDGLRRLCGAGRADAVRDRLVTMSRRAAAEPRPNGTPASE